MLQKKNQRMAKRSRGRSSSSGRSGKGVSPVTLLVAAYVLYYISKDTKKKKQRSREKAEEDKIPNADGDSDDKNGTEGNSQKKKPERIG